MSKDSEDDPVEQGHDYEHEHEGGAQGRARALSGCQRGKSL